MKSLLSAAGQPKEEVYTDDARMVLDPIYKQIVDNNVQIKRKIVSNENWGNSLYRNFYYIQ